MILMMKVAEHFQKLHGKVLKCCGGGWVVLRTIIRDSAVVSAAVPLWDIFLDPESAAIQSSKKGAT